jgi:nucleotide-binding universal stress UspA family protein
MTRQTGIGEGELRGDAWDRQPAVVVGIDGSQAALDAAAWAAIDAAVWHLPLRLIYVVPPIDKPAFRPGGARYREGQRILDTARRWVLAHRPNADDGGPEVDVAVVRGHPDRVLVTMSRSARLVAVGTTGIGCLAHLVLGSVVLTVCREARCPVAVVRSPADRRGPVLAVLTGWPASESTLLAAFRAAQARHADLVVARIWNGRHWADPIERETLVPLVSDAQIMHHRLEFPTVSVYSVTVADDPDAAVGQLTRNAQLVVVGRLGHGTAALISHSPCPVLVVPRHAPAAGTAAPTIRFGSSARIASTAANILAPVANPSSTRMTVRPAIRGGTRRSR